MDERAPSSLSAKVERLETRIEQLEHRLRSLEENLSEDTAPDAQETGPPSAMAGHESAFAQQEQRRQSALPLVGQTLLILGGAFLLRWLTETGLLPPASGTAVGLAYAGFWIVAAGRAASLGNRVSPSYRGLAAALIGFPLVWEATIKFGFLSHLNAAGALGIMTLGGLLVAWKWAIRPLAWAIVLAAVPTTIGMAFATKLFVPYLVLLLLVGLASLWLGYVRHWTTLAWMTGFVINSVIVLVTLSRSSSPVSPHVDTLARGSLVLLLLGLIAVYFGSFAARTLARRRGATVLEIGQSVTVLVIGFAGSFGLVRDDPTFYKVVGWTGLLLSGLCYATAFAFIDRSLRRSRNFLFYSSLGMGLLLMACLALLEHPAATITLALVAAIIAWVGGRWRRATLSLHGAIYLVGASICGGVFSVTGDAFVGSTVAPLGSISPSYYLVLVAAALCASFSVNTESSRWGRYARWTRAASLAVFLAATGGIVVVALAPALPSDAEGLTDTGALATTRAGVLAGSALLLAWVSRWRRYSEALWFVYPLLFACGAKVLFEDFRIGQSFTLFASLTFFGLALIIAPRLTRRAPVEVEETAAETSAD